ncbi:MAG: hypothetical protein V7L22_31640 [Nostoc sp.]
MTNFRAIAFMKENLKLRRKYRLVLNVHAVAIAPAISYGQFSVRMLLL